MLLILVAFVIFIPNGIYSVKLEYPTSEHIEERIRTDINSIDRIFQFYLVPREIQYHANALQDRLPFFIQCKGSKNTVKLTVPPSATEHLSLNTDYDTYTVTATLRRNQLRPELVGRYTCSETINDSKYETVAHIFVEDGKSIFTKKLYPAVLLQTGIHFFNLPCQTTSWFANLNCSKVEDPSKCQRRLCTPQEEQANELKCNMLVCPGQTPCIPVNYNPEHLKPTKVFFDPQIGFALENPIIPQWVNSFTCMSSYAPSQNAKVPFDSTDPDYIHIHQSSLSVLRDETLRLSCEIQYGSKIDRKIPTLFWFEDIYNLKLVANETEKAVFNQKRQIYSRNSSITLRGFQPNQSYRFYCVRMSDQGIFSRSIEIHCVNAPLLELDVVSSGGESTESVTYGSNSIYDLSILTIPRSEIIFEISRDGIPIQNDKRFQLISIDNRENQFHEYSLTIYNITFEDETDIQIIAKSSVLEKMRIIRPHVVGNPVGQISFNSDKNVDSQTWRNEEQKSRINIYSYGIFEQERYSAVCNVRHRADVQQPLNVSMQFVQCPIEKCLSDIIEGTCRSPSTDRIPLQLTRYVSKFQTEFITEQKFTIADLNNGHAFICCYEGEGNTILAKGITALARRRSMFVVKKPEFSLVTEDILNYRCEGHELVYDDLRLVYNDGYYTYQRNRFDAEWRSVGTNQPKQVDIDWLSTSVEDVRETIIEVKTNPLRKIGKNGFVQCIGLSRRSDYISHTNDTYFIDVDDPVTLQFKNTLPAVNHIERKAGSNVDFDCIYVGRPRPRVTWYKGKLSWEMNDSTLQIRENNGSITIARSQATDTGYYTCELFNGRDPILRRSFDLRVKGPIINSKFRRYTAIFASIAAILILVLIILLIIIAVKYAKIRKIVEKSMFRPQQSNEPEDKSKLPMTQLNRLPLPANFASSHQVKALLSYVNGETAPDDKDDFKELGRGQYGVVYQVRLPEVGLVAAKLLPQSIRNQEKPRAIKAKNKKDNESVELLNVNIEAQKKKAAEMLIDELKVMNRAGKHVNIVSLLRVAYPEAKLKYVFKSGLIRDEDSFYLMELCSNGSLESMLKRFREPSSNQEGKKPSLYEALSRQHSPNMTLAHAHEMCELTDDDLQLIAYQVASGIDYLNRNQIAHCDLAARNVLVTSRFIMKICDFGLATWTTYKNYREKLERNESVQLEKKNNDIATHNLTPELARAFLRASSPDERLLLNKSSIKSDVWSFGIFLWTLFLKCQYRPFHKLVEEMERRPTSESFFQRLIRIVSDGQVLNYIEYYPEIPRNVYAIIRECLVEENKRPEMIRINTFLGHTKMLSKRAFEYYRSQYNSYQEESTDDGRVLMYGIDQAVSELPSFDGNSNDKGRETSPYKQDEHKGVIFRPKTTDEYYGSASNATDTTYVIEKDADERSDSYLIPTANDPPKNESASASTPKKKPPPVPPKPKLIIPTVEVKQRGPLRPAPPPPKPPSNPNWDSYV